MMAASAVFRTSGDYICSRCITRLVQSSAQQTLRRSSIHTRRKLHGGIVPSKSIQRNMHVSQTGFVHEYFSANSSIDRGWVRNGLLAAFRTVAEKPRQSANGATRETIDTPNLQDSRQKFVLQMTSQDRNMVEEVKESTKEVEPVAGATNVATETDILPHRRRKRKKAAIGNEDEVSKEALPLDASSQLTTAATSLPASATFRRRFATYLSLTKPRLSFLILLTTTSAYSLYPIPEILSSNNTAVEASTTLSTSTLTLLFLTSGTFLSCACANTLNMLFEPKYDALMTRTRNRPLVRKLVTMRAAYIFAFLCGASGLTLLYFGTNPTVASLSAFNIFMYAGVYTPLKRISAVNTWAGAIVGGIPPLMGWCAAAGQAATSEHHSWQDLLFSESSVGGWLLAALLFAWQFPHFMSLSHTIRDDYRNAGHKMLAWTNPARNARVALRYSLAMFPICGGLYVAGIVNQGFLAISTACNLWMTREAFRFWRKQGAGGSARGLFWASVWQLPLVLVGALVCKSGIWNGFFSQEEAISIYEEENDMIRDGEELKMATSKDSKSSKTMPDINLAMLGFKRPS